MDLNKHVYINFLFHLTTGSPVDYMYHMLKYIKNTTNFFKHGEKDHVRVDEG